MWCRSWSVWSLIVNRLGICLHRTTGCKGMSAVCTTRLTEQPVSALTKIQQMWCRSWSVWSLIVNRLGICLHRTAGCKGMSAVCTTKLRMLIAVYLDAVIPLFETTADLTSSKRLKVIDRLTKMFRISPKKTFKILTATSRLSLEWQKSFSDVQLFHLHIYLDLNTFT